MAVIPGGRDGLHAEARTALLDCLVHGKEDAEARLYEIDGILSRRGALRLACASERDRPAPPAPGPSPG